MVYKRCGIFYRHLLVWSFLIIFSQGFIFAQTYWVRYGWQTFRNAGDARILALGGHQAADVGTSVTPLFNPAATGQVGLHSITYAHQSRLAGMINSDLLSFPLTILNHRPVNVIFLHEGISQIPDTRSLLLDFGADGIPGTGDIGEGNGILDEGERLDEEDLKYFSQRQLGLYFSTAWVWKKFRVGFGLKGLHHILGEFSAVGIGMDLGLYILPWKDGRIGLTMRDITTSWLVWNNGSVERTAPALLIGVAQQFNFSRFPLSVIGYSSLEIEAAGQSVDDDFKIGSRGGNFHLGVNLVYDYKVAIRLGRNGVGATTAGLGLSWSNFSLDYAFQAEPQGSGLGTSHYTSMSFNPAWLKTILSRL
ncbi:MAG: hypothetical protein ACE5D2_01545 [Fidelibacterota bacterium]